MGELCEWPPWLICIALARLTGMVPAKSFCLKLQSEVRRSVPPYPLTSHAFGLHCSSMCGPMIKRAGTVLVKRKPFRGWLCVTGVVFVLFEHCSTDLFLRFL